MTTPPPSPRPSPSSVSRTDLFLDDYPFPQPTADDRSGGLHTRGSRTGGRNDGGDALLCGDALCTEQPSMTMADSFRYNRVQERGLMELAR